MAPLRDIELVTSSQSLNGLFDTFFIDASGGNIIFTMDDISSSDGENYVLKRIDIHTTNSVTIKGFNSNQKINGSTSLTFATGESRYLVSYGGNWYYCD